MVLCSAECQDVQEAIGGPGEPCAEGVRGWLGQVKVQQVGFH